MNSNVRKIINSYFVLERIYKIDKHESNSLSYYKNIKYECCNGSLYVDDKLKIKEVFSLYRANNILYINHIYKLSIYDLDNNFKLVAPPLIFDRALHDHFMVSKNGSIYENIGVRIFTGTTFKTYIGDGHIARNKLLMLSSKNIIYICNSDNFNTIDYIKYEKYFTVINFDIISVDGKFYTIKEN